MKVYEFGNKKNPVILLLPGTCCHWKINFEKHIPLLQEKFYVAAVSYDGFDETEDTVFTDMLSETRKIETYIKEHFDGKIYAAYGCSLGGSFVSLLVQRKNIHIDHAILGSSDMDQAGKLVAKLESAIIGAFLPKLIHKGKLPGFMKKSLAKKTPEEQEYMKAMLASFTANGKGLPFVKKESMCNQFYSDLVTKIEDDIDVSGTVVHVFYALKMGEQYEARYRRHFAKPDICRHDYQHEELFFRYPEKWYREVLRVCRMEESGL